MEMLQNETYIGIAWKIKVSNEGLQRRRRDSNPRAPEGKRISSAPRYDHFDTSAYVVRRGPRSGKIPYYTTSTSFDEVES